MRLPEEPNLPDATFVSDSLVALAPIPPRSPPVVVVAACCPVAAPRGRFRSPGGPFLPAGRNTGRARGASGDARGRRRVVYGDRIAIRPERPDQRPRRRVLADARSIARIPAVPLPRGGSPSPRHGRHRRAAGHAHWHCRRLRLARGGRPRRRHRPGRSAACWLPDDELLGANVLALGGHAFLGSGKPDRRPASCMKSGWQFTSSNWTSSRSPTAARPAW